MLHVWDKDKTNSNSFLRKLYSLGKEEKDKIGSLCYIVAQSVTGAGKTRERGTPNSTWMNGNT